MMLKNLSIVSMLPTAYHPGAGGGVGHLRRLQVIDRLSPLFQRRSIRIRFPEAKLLGLPCLVTAERASIAGLGFPTTTDPKKWVL